MHFNILKTFSQLIKLKYIVISISCTNSLPGIKNYTNWINEIFAFSDDEFAKLASVRIASETKKIEKTEKEIYALLEFNPEFSIKELTEIYYDTIHRIEQKIGFVDFDIYNRDIKYFFKARIRSFVFLNINIDRVSGKLFTTNDTSSIKMKIRTLYREVSNELEKSYRNRVEKDAVIKNPNFLKNLSLMNKFCRANYKIGSLSNNIEYETKSLRMNILDYFSSRYLKINEDLKNTVELKDALIRVQNEIKQEKIKKGLFAGINTIKKEFYAGINTIKNKVYMSSDYSEYENDIGNFFFSENKLFAESFQTYNGIILSSFCIVCLKNEKFEIYFFNDIYFNRIRSFTKKLISKLDEMLFNDNFDPLLFTQNIFKEIICIMFPGLWMRFEILKKIR